MADLLIRNIPGALYRRLKSRAKERGTSMNREALVLLTEGLGVPVQDPEEFLAAVRELRQTLFRKEPKEPVARTIFKIRHAR